MALLSTYLDKSGYVGKPLIVVAGFIASDKQWDDLGKAWGKASKGISDFHMDDFMGGRKEFNNKDWPQFRKDKLIKKPTEIIAEKTRARVGMGIVCKAFRGANLAQRDKEYTRDEYRICCSMAIIGIAEWAKDSDKRKKVDFVFDRDGKFYNKTSEIYHLASTDPTLAGEWKLGGFSVSDRKSALGLQAADMLTYLINEYQCGVLRGNNPATLHPYLAGLLKIHKSEKRQVEKFLKTSDGVEYYAKLFSEGFAALPPGAFKRFNPALKFFPASR